MNRRLPWLIFLAAVLALVFWGWLILFPGPDRIIRKHLAEVAHLASVTPNEGPLARLANAQKLTTFCTADVEIAVDIPGRTPQTLSGRDELLQTALAVRSMMSNLKVEFLDVGVALESDEQSAVARLTAKANLPGENIPEVQELKIAFQKAGRDWLIRRAETVRTLH